MFESMDNVFVKKGIARMTPMENGMERKMFKISPVIVLLL